MPPQFQTGPAALGAGRASGARAAASSAFGGVPRRRLLPIRVVGAQQCAGSCLPARAGSQLRFSFCSYLQKELVPVRKSGAWEPDVTNALVKALSAAPEAQFIDVGARTGWFTTVAAVAGHHVIALEPNPRSNCFIERNAAINNVSDRVVVLDHGADEQNRVLTLEGMRLTGRAEDGTNTLTNNTSGPTKHEAQRAFTPSIFTPTPEKVSTVRIDSLLPLLRSDTLVMQMDVEGFECEALRGASHVLRTRRVALLMHEWDGGSDAAERGCDWVRAWQPLRDQGLRSFNERGAMLEIAPGTKNKAAITVMWR